MRNEKRDQSLCVVTAVVYRRVRFAAAHQHGINIPSASHPHPIRIPSASHPHPIRIPSASHPHPIRIPSASHQHPTSINQQTQRVECITIQSSSAQKLVVASEESVVSILCGAPTTLLIPSTSASGVWLGSRTVHRHSVLQDLRA